MASQPIVPLRLKRRAPRIVISCFLTLPLATMPLSKTCNAHAGIAHVCTAALCYLRFFLFRIVLPDRIGPVASLLFRESTSMSHRLTLFSLLALTGLLLAADAAAADVRPNIVFLFADD